ncbi:hypothetical protein L2E82_38798 [Cichorium intybus]|uniref:Uncharacterized protein n=1 Tax=Cichorium intybus TaxID=13427 RepID=A0ACB9AFR3_CICIN|nr:hypothetical protein L2E82_38798 [Cichorium intybus]
MGTFESFRKAFGALKDSTTVGIAKVNSEFKVAIKTLIVFHRTLREGDPSFREELLNYSPPGQLFLISSFKDDSSPLAWDCSAWVRAYGRFIEERLECYRVLKYDVESEHLTKYEIETFSRRRLRSGDELLEQLSAMQQLLNRLIGCQPEGAAYHNYLVQYALALVVKESFKIYCAINDGIIHLVDMFFDMPRHDAIKALNIYKRAGKQAEYLAEFYDFYRHLDLARNFQFPTLRQPPPSFLTTMEEYIKEAPSIGLVSIERLEYEEIEEEEQTEETDSQENEINNEQVEVKDTLLANRENGHISPFIDANNHDLLGLQELINPKAKEIDESNAMALAIVENGHDHQSSSMDWSEIQKTSGWELALVENNINISNNTSQPNLGGGFDKFLLDSLYDDDIARKRIQLQNAGYNTSHGYNMQYNPFNQQDPFMMSNGVTPPTNVQMAMLDQQHQQITMNQQQPYHNHYPQLYQQPQPYPQQNMLVPYNNGYATGTSNPFGDVYEYPQSSTPSHGNHGLL